MKYAIDPTAPLPKRWRDEHGPIRIMGGPHEGYVLARRPGCMPFVLTVKQLLNTEKHPYHGPFEPARSPVSAQKEKAE